jgi:hypothetical protein
MHLHQSCTYQAKTIQRLIMQLSLLPCTLPQAPSTTLTYPALVFYRCTVR